MARASPLYGELVAQYLALRDGHPGILLLFRVGSFYEVLFEDAELVARELGLKLGDRPSGGSAGPVPQCGFAAHALDQFMPRLLARGYRVAVCEEGDAAESQGAVRHRAVVRTLTPGTVTDPKLLAEDQPTYLVALANHDDRVGLAWTDVAAGEFQAGEFDADAAAAELQRLAPAEVLLPADVSAPAPLLARWPVTPVGPAAGAADRLAQLFPDGALSDLPLAQAAAGVVVRYLAATRGDDTTPPIDPPRPADRAGVLQLDSATQRHLEIVETERARERAGSLLDTVDRAVTPMGRRMLRGWLLRPLVDLAKIGVRQAIVAELVANPRLRASLAGQLAGLPDLERLAGRAASGRATADDLRALVGAARTIPALAETVTAARHPFLRRLGRDRQPLRDFASRAQAVLAEPDSPRPVRPDATGTLAEATGRLDRASAWQTRYVQELRQTLRVDRLTLERTSTQGLFLEVPANTPVPSEWTRRGGLQRVERYSTRELERHAVEIAEAESQVATEVRALLADLRGEAANVASEARDIARYLAAADALLSLAAVAAEREWVCPELDDTGSLAIVGGRHPVVERPGPFQPNDAHLEARGQRDQVVLLTGPNMAGKSTWLRQTALIVLLAQTGSFVPAQSARIGVADAIFTRIGAVDDVAGGRSTFMVEMLETATVLRGVTDRGLVLLDEIGRGTSTHDGMAIAWAVIEHLVTGPARPRAIVATHYHELAALRSVHPEISLMRAAVDDRSDGIVFTHRIEAGAADRSYGIEVARLAGLPETVLARAREVSKSIEPVSADIARRLGATPGREC